MQERGGAARSRAFTLIEVLLAVAVFAIILLAMHGVFHGALRLRNKTTQAMEQAVPLQQALAILKRDLANIVAPGGTMFGEFQTTPTTSALGSQSQSTQTTSGQTPSSQAGLSPSFAAFNSVSLRGVVVSPAFCTAVGLIDDTAPWGEVQRVLYYLAQPTNNTPGKDLMRSVSRNLLPVLQEEQVDQWVLSGVQDVFFSYYDGLQWQPVWDSTLQSSNKLPLAIKVELQLVTEITARQQPEPITLVVPLPVQGGTNSTTQATGGAQ